MKILGNMLLGSVIIALIGFIVQQLLVHTEYFYIGYVIVGISFLSISIISLIQLVKSCFTFKKNIPLVIISILMNLLLPYFYAITLRLYVSMGGFLFFKQTIIPLYILIALIFILFIKKIKSSESFNYFKKNIMIPWSFLFILFLIPLIMPEKLFYNYFCYNRIDQSFEKHKGQKYNLFLLSNQDYNLNVNDIVVMNDRSIGEISKLRKYNDFFIFTISISYDNMVPVNSHFSVVNQTNATKDEMILIITSNEAKKYSINSIIYFNNDISEYLSKEIQRIKYYIM